MQLFPNEVSYMYVHIDYISIIIGFTSLPDILKHIRQHYGFQSKGAHFQGLVNKTLKPAEKPDDLF